jgi:hypothetical protein
MLLHKGRNHLSGHAFAQVHADIYLNFDPLEEFLDRIGSIPPHRLDHGIDLMRLGRHARSAQKRLPLESPAVDNIKAPTSHQSQARRELHQCHIE